MAIVIYGNTEVEVDGARWRDGDVWVPVGDLPATTGWEVKPEGVCAGATWVPTPPDATWTDGDAFNLSTFAPDFTLPDLDGRLHSLSDYRGSKVVLLTWASF